MSIRSTHEVQEPGFDPRDNDDHRGIDESIEEDVFDPKGKDTFRRRVIITAATIAAGAAAVAAFGFGQMKSGSTEIPQQRPTAAAGATPGEQAPTPTASAEVGTTGETLDTFTYNVMGKEYVGEDALKRGIGVSTEAYPGNTEAGAKKVVEAFFSRLNLWENLEPTAKQKEEFATYMGKDGHQGDAGMNVDLVNPGFIDALSSDPPEGVDTTGMQSPDDWFSQQAEHLNQTYGNRNLAKEEYQPGDEGYKSGWEVSDKDIYIPVFSKNQIDARVQATYTDNGSKNALGRERTADADGFQDITTENIHQKEMYHFTFMKNPEFNTWDVVSIN